MKKHKFSRVISSIIVFIVIICAIGMVISLTTDVQSVVSTISPMYLVVDDVEIRDHSSGYFFDVEKPLMVDIKYDIDLGIFDSSSYTVKVVPNVIPEYNFDITAGNESFPYQEINDLSSGFYIDKIANSFTVTPKGGINTILSYVYPNSSIDDCTEKAYKDMYTLVVSSADGKTSITIDFSIAERYNAITLDMSNIIF